MRDGLILQIACSSCPPPIPPDLSPEFRDFTAACLRRDAYMRPTASQLLTHPVFAACSEE